MYQFRQRTKYHFFYLTRVDLGERDSVSKSGSHPHSNDAFGLGSSKNRRSSPLNTNQHEETRGHTLANPRFLLTVSNAARKKKITRFLYDAV